MAPAGTLVQGSQDKTNRRRPHGSTEDADRKGDTEPRRGSRMIPVLPVNRKNYLAFEITSSASQSIFSKNLFKSDDLVSSMR